MTQSARRFFTAAAVLAAAGALAACSHGHTAAAQGPADQRQPGESRLGDAREGGIGIPFFGRHDRQDSAGGGRDSGGIGVNSFLWRASLDTLSFMPLASADPFGGVIITDWYSDPQKPNERFKATVYILDTRLRADALNVSVFRQQMTATGWQDATVTSDTNIQLENAILTRARQLRLSTLRD